MTEAKHLPLDTPMIHWPRLGDVLDEVMHNIERNVWDQEFENRADLTDDLKDREPDSMSRCLTDLETILETAPRLREVLDEARCSYEIPDHAWNILEHALEGSVQLMENAITDEERQALLDLARKSILGGEKSPEE